MSNKMNKNNKDDILNNSCDRFLKHTSRQSSDNVRTTRKKLVTSRKQAIKPCKETTSMVKGSITTKKTSQIVKPKKTAKSEVCITRRIIINREIDYCNYCGDDSSNIYDNTLNDNIQTFIQEDRSSKPIIDTIKSKTQIKKDKKIDVNVKQFYKNENFKQTSESTYEITDGIKKPSLATIKEVSEKTETVSIPTYSQIYSSDSKEDDFLDPDDKYTIKKLKEFRTNNYFECHSAKSRIKLKPSVTSLKDHKCSYRFYLNDRLFPVPLNVDYNNEVRCVECHLPLKRTQYLKEDINGVIQAKVKIGSGDTVQDILLMLPVKEPLIIKERRKEINLDNEVVYFGIVKLTTDYSVFNQNQPGNSLALKYQKGYKDLDNKDCQFDKVREGDVIII